ncbi:lysine exporter LysO family protein [Xenorhabdus sp. XENO-10]|uniref:Lysine exporter LysO family protein n=1 Tax=Xenorhabdus yunnanensis TaxID=3025878 RepID=A0ABT5LCS3_9GAMM|nr:lysine exporter LysO family protein [Xenorhabdus yunnanensis]MDC9588301.1 lysine exporter LysO family protein [Xenorhabdus yunnanensis]
MNIAISNLLPILIAFVVGFNFNKFFKHKNIRLIDLVSNLCLYSLLILMGITIGAIPGIISKLTDVGINAISIAFASSLSIVIVLKFFHIKTAGNEKNKVTTSNNQKDDFDIMGYIKDPILLASLVIIGFFLGYYKITPEIDYDIVISLLLYLLIFVIAMKLSLSGLSLKEIFFNRYNIVMTFFTIAASYIGAALISFFIPLSLTQSLAVSSGFGWYTLSGILFTKMNDPLLGSVAFLCDLFREVIALLLIPTLSRIGNGNIAIGVAGATAMDVTLPIIEKHCGISYVPVALLSGGIITILVPFLIPFFYSL